MRNAIFLSILAVSGCASTHGIVSPDQHEVESAVLLEISGYAMASCLAYQDDPQIQHQGFGWASAVVQRMEGGIDMLTGVADQVKLTSSATPAAAIRDETAPRKELQLSIRHCYETLHEPAVQAAIQDAVHKYTQRFMK